VLASLFKKYPDDVFIYHGHLQHFTMRVVSRASRFDKRVRKTWLRGHGCDLQKQWNQIDIRFYKCVQKHPRMPAKLQDCPHVHGSTFPDYSALFFSAALAFYTPK
jgi:hypothetical protein